MDRKIVMLTGLTEAEKSTPPDLKWAKEECRIGQGSRCCRYITMGADGWSCEKSGQFRQQLDQRAELGAMVATSDNCEGRASQ